VRPVPVNRSVRSPAAQRWHVALPSLPWRWQILALMTGSGAGWVLVASGTAIVGPGGAMHAVPLLAQLPRWLPDVAVRCLGVYVILAAARTVLATDGLRQLEAAPRRLRFHAAIPSALGLCMLAVLVLLGSLVVALGWVGLTLRRDRARARRWLATARRTLRLGFLAE
jgi:hypothetical protein